MTGHNVTTSNGAAGHEDVLTPATNAVHGDSLTVPIVQTSAYFFKNTQELIDLNEGRYKSYEYGRFGNPTTRACEEKICSLEGAEDCLVFASGMNAASTMMLALLPNGSHLIITSDCFHGTQQFIQTFLPRLGITTTVIDSADVAGLEQALEQHAPVTMFFSESPTNPLLRCLDIPRVTEMCHARGCLVAIDGTFATPINCQPLRLGEDLVMHSATKYLAGHHDVLAGAVAGKAELVAKVRSLHTMLGGTIDPHAAYLLLRGMKTLDLRVQRQNSTALLLAMRLEAHPKIARVHYPGLDGHPDHAVATKQMAGFGGVVSFEVEGDFWKTAKFVDSMRLAYIAPSLGGVETLITQPKVIYQWGESGEQHAGGAVSDSLVRLACGVEDPEDLWADLAQALDQI
ncbi:hypothetical protein N2152v2_004050 [Parachlorella kessleri]